MNVIDSIRSRSSPIHPEGYLLRRDLRRRRPDSWLIYAPLGWIGLVLTLWCAYFFRDPPRLTPLEDDLVIAPADGMVASVGPGVPPPELGLGAEAFASHFHLHVGLRLPCEPRPCRRPDQQDRLSARPFHQCRSRQGERGQRAQRPRHRCAAGRASAWFRSPASWRGGSSVSSRPARHIEAGERFGLIRFGSRVDVYLPHAARPLVGAGARAVGGETIIADFDSPAPPPHVQAELDLTMPAWLLAVRRFRSPGSALCWPA